MSQKILYLITQAEIGGAQKYILDLAKAARKKGYHVVVASEASHYLRDALNESDITFREIRNVQREIDPFRDAKLFWEIFRIIRSEKPDILHLNSSKIGAVGAIMGKLARIRHIVFTAHGWAFNDVRPQWQRSVIVAISRFVARFQDHIVCVSDYDKQRALEFHVAPETKLTTILNGISPRSLTLLPRAEARAHLTIGENDFVVGTIANFYKNKSLDTLVFAAISAHKPNVKFVIIGDGPERVKIESLIAKYRLDDRFILPGAIRNASSYLKAFDVFVLPSKKEGLPYALLEAMAAKLPCVTTSVGGIPEIIKNGENGIIIPHLTPGKLWDAVSGLAADKKRARDLGTHALETIKQRFSLQEMIDKTLDAYRKYVAVDTKTAKR